MSVMRELDDLIEQATKERSHYYVKSVAVKAQAKISALAERIESLEAERDDLRMKIHQRATDLIAENKPEHISATLLAERNAAEARIKELEVALRGIIEIGKRDISNPKYDSYFEEALVVLEKK